MATTRRSRWSRTRVGAGGIVLLGAATLAHGAPPVAAPTIDISAVATDNSGLTAAPLRRHDEIGDVDLGLVLRGRGSHVTLTGDIGLDFIGYAEHTQPDRVLPRGRAELNSTLVERALFFDASLDAARTRSDPLAPQVDGASTANTVSTVSLRASPYFSHEFTPTFSALVRNDTIVTRSKGDDGSGTVAPNGSTNQRDVVRLESKPTPVGASLEVSHEETSYQDLATPVMRTDTARVVLSDALDTEFLTGVIGGRDHVTYADQDVHDSRYGLMAEWRPSQRTLLDASVEHRFFGYGWDVHLRDRLSQAVFDLSLRRAPSASPATFALGVSDSDPAALLDALLSSRIPGAADRDEAVDALVASRGLPSDFAEPLQIFSESAQLSTRATLNFLLNGVRNTIYASLYYDKAAPLPGVAAILSDTTFDSRQWGGSIGLYHRLTPDTSGGAEISWSDIVALGARAGESSRQVVTTLGLTRRLGPRTSLSCGVRHFSARVVLDSSATSSQVTENQAFAGLRVQY